MITLIRLGKTELTIDFMESGKKLDFDKTFRMNFLLNFLNFAVSEILVIPAKYFLAITFAEADESRVAIADSIPVAK